MKRFVWSLRDGTLGSFHENYNDMGLIMFPIAFLKGIDIAVQKTETSKRTHWMNAGYTPFVAP